MMKKYNIKLLWLLPALLPTGMLLFYLSSLGPGFMERIYSKGIFRGISFLLNIITGFIPFSIAEFGLVLLAVGAVALLCWWIWQIIRGKDKRLLLLGKGIYFALCAVSVIYFVLIVLWGLNYSRYPFSRIIGIETGEASVEQLKELCLSLIDEANTQRAILKEDSSGVMKLDDGKYEALARAIKGYDKASERLPELGGWYGKPKPVFFSHHLSYTGIAGVYCPFTGEANVNMAMPEFQIPSTACHEMAHQRGFAREDEANYIAYLTCRLHPDADFRYSGTMLALIHSMNALYSYDPESYFELRKLYSEAVARDLEFNNRFWEAYEGPVERIATDFNDAYLKANMQKDGVHSYGRMVDLLIAEYVQNKKTD